LLPPRLAVDEASELHVASSYLGEHGEFELQALSLESELRCRVGV